uniref:Actin filament-associated protein 1-like 2 n=1 Tax=Periophthalmus magnuspinnatus TaxID=409849 RepID=A0A3B4B2M8_9GOBI
MERIKEKKKSLLDRLLVELHRFLLILDKENLSGNATVHKSMLSDLLQTYRGPAGMGTHSDISKTKLQWKNRECLHQCLSNTAASGKALIASLSHFPDDGEAVSSSYESYDEEEVTKGKCPSAQHQWPSAEAPFELMRDSRICAFLWRKKWLGQWAKQLCVIRDDRLMCYKSSKEQTPLLDVSLLGCSVVYKEKQLKRKEHRLKIVPMGGEAIVLGLQSREQTEQWLKVKFPQQELMLKQTFVSCKNYTVISFNTHNSSESGSSTDSHTETCENKDVKKKFQFSNLMNIGKKKPLSLESPEKCIDTSGYLNVLVNSQWRTCWCLIKNGQLWFYQDKNKSKISQPAVSLEGCSVCPDPSPEHLYSFRIHSDGTQLTTLEAKTSADMGHWLGLLLSQMGSKTNPEDLTYDYVNAERISSIVNAAKTSLYLMQRRYSEPNTYIDTPPSFSQNSDELYDDVASLPDPEVLIEDSNGTKEDADSKIYLDLIPVRSFLHTSVKDSPGKNTVPEFTEQHIEPKEVSSKQYLISLDLCVYVFLASHGAVEVKLGKNRTEADLRRYRDEREHLEREREEVRSSLANLKKERSEVKEELTACQDPKEQAALEARLKEKDEACREAERRRVEVELQLVEVKENLKKAESGPFTLGTTLDLQDTLLNSVRKTPTSTVSGDPASPVNSASALKNRPVSIMATKGKVLQKAKGWESHGSARNK